MAKARKRQSANGTKAKLQKLVQQYRKADADRRAKERVSRQAAQRANRLRAKILAAVGTAYRIVAQAVRYTRTKEGKYLIEAHGLKSVKPLGSRARGRPRPKVSPWTGALPDTIGPVYDPELACALYVDFVDDLPPEVQAVFEDDDDPLPPNIVAECYDVYCETGCRPRHQGNADGGVIWCECPGAGYPVG
ncbi:MAG: hypothetical protein HYS13_17565 [Planctomycetia bacterium]|nr:hypothetical protein [Planctomycetia bacterium]